MTAAQTLRTARRRAGLTLRRLAGLAGTSHATLAAYERGTKVPRVDTLERILRAAGFAADLRLAPRADNASTRAAKAAELAAVLELAGQFPARHDPDLRYPPFGRRAS